MKQKKKKKQARLRDGAALRQSGCCYYCGQLMCFGSLDEFATAHRIRRNAAWLFQCTAEHLIALSEGGRTAPDNIVAAHRYCNQTRHRRKHPQGWIPYKQRVQKSVSKNRWPTVMLLRPG